MQVKQIYTGCLSQGSYYIESNGEAAVIDPIREVDEYISLANNRGSKIKYIFETHFHADFVSGHVTLSKLTGAPIVFGPTAVTDFNCIIAEDNQEFILGDCKIRLLHTPGHTLESSCYLLIDKYGKETSLFSGDTLFLGDVGRPDLAQKSIEMTQERLAEILYDSLRNKIMTLPDDVIVYPGHGSGSSCGKNMSKETIGTIGNEKVNNYALRKDMKKSEFVEELIDGLLPPPQYFPQNVQLNRKGYGDVNDILQRSSNSISVSKFKEYSCDSQTIILDVRHQNDFVQGFVPGSIFIGINGGFAPWVGSILKDINTRILLVLEEEMLQETIIRLSRVGFDNVLGYLEGGIKNWIKSGEDIDFINSISPEVFGISLKKNINIIDVRKKTEYNNSHVEDAHLSPLSQLNKKSNALSYENENYLYCAGGYRSVIACSILKKEGIHNINNIQGGFSEIIKFDIPIKNNE